MMQFKEGVKIPITPSDFEVTYRGKPIDYNKIKGGISCEVSGQESKDTDVSFAIKFTVGNSFCQLKSPFEFDENTEKDKVALESTNNKELPIQIDNILYIQNKEHVKFVVAFVVEKGKIGGAGIYKTASQEEVIQ